MGIGRIEVEALNCRKRRVGRKAAANPPVPNYARVPPRFSRHPGSGRRYRIGYRYRIGQTYGVGRPHPRLRHGDDSTSGVRGEAFPVHLTHAGVEAGQCVYRPALHGLQCQSLERRHRHHPKAGAESIEVQNSSILFVACIITKVKGGGRIIQ